MVRGAQMVGIKFYRTPQVCLQLDLYIQEVQGSRAFLDYMGMWTLKFYCTHDVHTPDM